MLQKQITSVTYLFIIIILNKKTYSKTLNYVQLLSISNIYIISYIMTSCY